MRVLVACDAMAGLSPRQASEQVARAFVDNGAQVAVIPLALGGQDFVDAQSTLDPTAELVAPDSLDGLVAALRPGPGALVLDLTGMPVPPLAELVEAMTAERLAGLGAALAGRDVVALVGDGTHDAALTGLSGSLAELGRLRGDDLAATIADDGRAESWAQSLGVDPLEPGVGAMGGVGLILKALGSTLTTPLGHLVDGYGLAGVLAKADLAVTGTARLDFHHVGGPIVARMSQAAADALRPVVVIAGRTYVSDRELRLAGIEEAHAVLPGFDDEEPTPEQLLEAARRVADTWRW